MKYVPYFIRQLLILSIRYLKSSIVLAGNMELDLVRDRLNALPLPELFCVQVISCSLMNLAAHLTKRLNK